MSMLAMLAGTVAAQVQEPRVLTQHNDNYRTGANLNETVLNTDNVNVSGFGKLFSRSVDGFIYAQPLYVPNLAMPDSTIRNVVYVATEHNSVYAFDADDPAASQPLWRVNLGPSVLFPVRCSDSGGSGGQADMPEVGITSTPVIDEAAGIMYVEAMVDSGKELEHWLHALDVQTGAEKPGSPVLIEGSVAGTGDGSQDGVLVFTPEIQLQRVALTLANGAIYIAFASFCDTGSYHGWIFKYDAASLRQVGVVANTPDGSQGGVWQSGQGLSVDDSGALYYMTGNGDFDRTQTPPVNLGDSIVKLDPFLAVVDWFTPFNESELSVDDVDLGSAGTLLIPGRNLLVGGGKEGKLYVVDTSPGQMGGFNETFDAVLQSFYVIENSHIHGSPVLWDSPAGPQIYVWAEEDMLKAYRLAGNQFRLVSTSEMPVADGMPGGFLAVSANGARRGSAIVWASLPLEDATDQPVPGILRAFDASDLSRELWNSEQNQQRDAVGDFAKFCPPTIANGKVYLATFSGTLDVYGLLQ